MSNTTTSFPSKIPNKPIHCELGVSQPQIGKRIPFKGKKSQRVIWFNFFLVLCFFLSVPILVGAPNPPDSFAVEDVLINVDQPIAMRFLPDDRLLLVQKKGQIQIGNVLGDTITFEDYADFTAPEHLLGLDSGNEKVFWTLLLTQIFLPNPTFTPFTLPRIRLTVLA